MPPLRSSSIWRPVSSAWQTVAHSFNAIFNEFGKAMRGSITRGVGDASLQSLLERAVALQLAGQPAAAGRLYETVLARDPENADALNLLGVVRHKLGDSEGGAALIRRAIARDSN